MAGMHIIQKSHLKIKVRDKVRAFEIQSEVIEAFHSKVMRALEQELDKWAPEGRVIQIDRLVLDLGSISVENLHEELPRLVREKMKEVFPQVMNTDAGQKERTKVVQLTSEDSDLETMMGFLETGRMGWEVDASSSSPAQMMEALLLAQPEALRRGLEMRLGRGEVAKRLSLQFPASLLDKLLDLLAGSQAGAVQGLIRAVLGMAAEWASLLPWLPGNPSRREGLVYAAVLRHLPAANYRLPAGEIMRRLLVDRQLHPARFETDLKALDLPALLGLLGLVGGEFVEVSKRIQGGLEKGVAAKKAETVVIRLVQRWLMAYAMEETWVAPGKAMLHAGIVA
jgi:hypothetical protein